MFKNVDCYFDDLISQMFGAQNSLWPVELVNGTSILQGCNWLLQAFILYSLSAWLGALTAPQGSQAHVFLSFCSCCTLPATSIVPLCVQAVVKTRIFPVYFIPEIISASVMTSLLSCCFSCFSCYLLFLTKEICNFNSDFLQQNFPQR